jgi:SanA protein
VNDSRRWREVFRRPAVRVALAVLVASAGWIGVEAWRIKARVAPFVSADAASLPAVNVGLVLGCSRVMSDGRTKLFFERRIAAAAELYKLGKVKFLLVSGDNSRVGYDEPTEMMGALVAAGVPASSIVRDYAGFRTLDSVLRAQQVFGLKEVIIVSQRFHNERALYLARAHGMKAWGFDARAVGGPEGLRVGLREVASRLAAVVDVEVLHSTPRFLGPREPTPF